MFCFIYQQSRPILNGGLCSMDLPELTKLLKIVPFQIIIPDQNKLSRMCQFQHMSSFLRIRFYHWVHLMICLIYRSVISIFKSCFSFPTSTWADSAIMMWNWFKTVLLSSSSTQACHTVVGSFFWRKSISFLYERKFQMNENCF